MSTTRDSEATLQIHGPVDHDGARTRGDVPRAPRVASARKTGMPVRTRLRAGAGKADLINSIAD